MDVLLVRVCVCVCVCECVSVLGVLTLKTTPAMVVPVFLAVRGLKPRGDRLASRSTFLHARTHTHTHTHAHTHTRKHAHRY